MRHAVIIPPYIQVSRRLGPRALEENSVVSRSSSSRSDPIAWRTRTNPWSRISCAATTGGLSAFIKTPGVWNAGTKTLGGNQKDLRNLVNPLPCPATIIAPESAWSERPRLRNKNPLFRFPMGNKMRQLLKNFNAIRTGENPRKKYALTELKIY